MAKEPIGLIDAALLKVACPDTNIGELAMWVEPIKSACDRYAINTVRRVAAFIAQMAVESAGFTHLSENLNYSADRLAAVWPNRYAVDPKARVKVPTAKAKALANNPEALANDVYANRLGNGGPETGDGWRFRGQDPLQMTGRDIWQKFADAVGMNLDAAMAYAMTREGGIAAAGWYWVTHHLNELADTPGTADESRAINGGDNALALRDKLTQAVIKELLRRGA